MRKQIFAAAAAALLLSGCVAYSGNDQTLINDSLAAAQAMPAVRPNYNKKYYSYYLPPEIGRVDSDETSNTFTLNGTKFIMNLDVAGIINTSYYQDQSEQELQIDSSDLAVQADGTYLDYSGTELPFQVRIYLLNGTYFTEFVSQYVQFYAVSDRLQSADLVSAMMQIAKSISIRSDEILAAFSSRQTISNTRTKLELFQNIAPENGQIEELFTDSGSHAGTSAGSSTTDNYATDNYPDSNSSKAATATPEPSAAVTPAE